MQIFQVLTLENVPGEVKTRRTQKDTPLIGKHPGNLCPQIDRSSLDLQVSIAIVAAAQPNGIERIGLCKTFLTYLKQA